MRVAIQILQIFSGVLGVGMVVWAFWLFSDRREARIQRRRGAGR
ncbi:hypothetical protein [Streptomyces microflavus]